MSNASDFIIENGVLKKYVGPGGGVVIPEGVFSIDKAMSFGDYRIVSISLPASLSNLLVGDDCWWGMDTFGDNVLSELENIFVSEDNPY